MRIDFTDNELMWLRQALLQAMTLLEAKVEARTPGAEKVWLAYKELHEKVCVAIKSEVAVPSPRKTG
jgi:hypothetical protein